MQKFYFKRIFLTMVVALLLSGTINAQQATANDWKLGVQMWSFHLNTFTEALEKTQSLGIKYIEGFPDQKIGGGIDGTMDFHMNESTQKKVKQLLKDHQIQMVSYGVITSPKNDDIEKLFQFAKAMNLENVAMEPEPEQIPLVSKMADQYGINVAIHNHPKPSMYWDPAIVRMAVENSSPRLGFCADIGHWLESDLDPVTILKKQKGHIVEFHLKDENRRGIQGNIGTPIYNKKGRIDQLATLISAMQQVAASGIVIVPLGYGVINMPGILQEMKEQQFKGYFFIEHEHNFADNVEEIKQGKEWFDKKVAELL